MINSTIRARRFKDICFPEVSDIQECYAELDHLGEVAEALVGKYASARSAENLNDIEEGVEKREYEDCMLEYARANLSRVMILSLFFIPTLFFTLI